MNSRAPRMPDVGNDTVILLDLSGYIFRAYHGIQHNLTNSKGFPTNAVYGVTRMLARLLSDHPDTEIIAVKDAPGPSWRHGVYPDYKANRPPAPEDLKVQFDKVHAVVDAMGIPMIELDGHEADDLIASLAYYYAGSNRPVLILSADKDLLQLVDERIIMWDPMRGTLYNAEYIREKWGVGPERIADLLALMGDSSDNVPGVAGIGKKRARDLIAQYGSMHTLLEKRDELPGQKWADNLRADPKAAELSYRLVVLPRDMPGEVDPTTLKRMQPDEAKLVPLFRELEFHSLLDQLTDVFPTVQQDLAAEPEPVGSLAATSYHTRTDLDGIVAELNTSPLAFDTETTDLHPRKAQLVGLSYAANAETGHYVPLAHRGAENLDWQTLKAPLKAWAEDETREKWGQNLKYDASVLLNEDIALTGIGGDAMLASYLLAPDSRGHGLDAMAERELGHTTTKFKDVADMGDFRLVDVEQATHYAGEDAVVAWAVCARLHERLKANDLWELYLTIELPLVPVLAAMEWSGVRIDLTQLAVLRRELQDRITKIEASIMKEFNRGINLQSPKQIGELLFDELGLPTKGVRKTKTGAWSTDVHVLEELEDAHPVVKQILEHRGFSKLLQTYVTGLSEAVLPQTGRIHPHFQQAIAATGRLACTDPNLQNIPIRDEWGHRIRQAFIPDEGCVFVGADYSQIELRILAHFTQDPGLISAFERGEDIHSRTAAEMLDVAIADVQPEHRRIAKTINFGLMYGMGAQKLAKSVGITQAEAKTYIEKYFTRFASVADYKERTIAAAQQDQYVQTLYGRKRWIPDINSGNKRLELQAERIAINTPIQGTAADIMKLAMIALHRRLRQDAPDARILLQVHDELLVECPADAATQVQQYMIEEMTGAATLSVPLEVESGIGNNWDEAH